MIIDEYLQQVVTLDWNTEDFDLATRIIRKLEERSISYECSKKQTKWAFVITTNNQNAPMVIEALRVG